MSESTQDETQDERMSDLLARFPMVDLDPALKPYLYESELGGQSLHHHFVVSPFYTPLMNDHYNKQYAYKVEATRRSLDNGQYNDYIFLHERPYRVDAFVALNDSVNLSDKDYWLLIGEIWIDSENIRQNTDVWEELLSSDRPARHWLMQHDELVALLEMPEKITVYQGCTTDRDDGWSWTTSRDTAIWFANRFSLLENSHPVLRSTTVYIADVLAYFSRRGENEVLINPYVTFNDTTEELLPRKGV